MESMLRRQLKQWQKAFREEHAREPSKKDIQKHPDIASVYDTWHAIRGAIAPSSSISSSSSKPTSNAPDPTSGHVRPSKKPRTESNSNVGPTPITPTRRSTTSRTRQEGRVSDAFEPKLNPFKTPTKSKSSKASANSNANGAGLSTTSISNHPPAAPQISTPRRLNPFATPTKSTATSEPSTPGSARSIVIVPQSPSRRWLTQGSATPSTSKVGLEDGRFDYAPSPSRLRDLISSQARYSPSARRRGNLGAGAASGTTWGLARDEEAGLRDALTPRSKARKRLKGEAVPPTPFSSRAGTREDGEGMGRSNRSRGQGKISWGKGLGNVGKARLHGPGGGGGTKEEGTMDEGMEDEDDVLGSTQFETRTGTSQPRLSSFMRSLSATRTAMRSNPPSESWDALEPTQTQTQSRTTRIRSSSRAKSRMMDEDQDEDQDELGPSPSREKSRGAAKERFASLFEEEEEEEEDGDEASFEDTRALSTSAALGAGAGEGRAGREGFNAQLLQTDEDEEEEGFGDASSVDVKMLDAAEARALEAAAEEEERERVRLRREERRRVRGAVGERRVELSECGVGIGEEGEGGREGMVTLTLRAYRMFERERGRRSVGLREGIKVDGTDEWSGDEDDDVDADQDEDEEEDEEDIVSFALRKSPSKKSVPGTGKAVVVGASASRSGSPEVEAQVMEPSIDARLALSTSDMTLPSISSTSTSTRDASQDMLASTLRLCLTSPKGGRARQLKARKDGERLRGILGDERELETLRLEDEMGDEGGGEEGDGKGKGKGRAGGQRGGNQSWGEAKFKERLSSHAAAVSAGKGKGDEGKGGWKLSKREIRKLEVERKKVEEEEEKRRRFKPMPRCARAGVADEEGGGMGSGEVEEGDWLDKEAENGSKGKRMEDSDWESGIEESDEEYGLGDGEMDLDDVV